MSPEYFIGYLRRMCDERKVKVDHGQFSREQGLSDAYNDIACLIDVYIESYQPTKENAA